MLSFAIALIVSQRPLPKVSDPVTPQPNQPIHEDRNRATGYAPYTALMQIHDTAPT